MDPMSTSSNPPDPAVSPSEERVAGYCRTCGKVLTDATKHVALGTVFCDEHAPTINASAPVEPPSPYLAAPSAATGDKPSPALAFILGFIPGVGAIYNGQYAKGLVHVLVFGLLISILNNDEMSGGFQPLFGMLLGVFVFYQCFEAYHTAQKRAAGQPIDELSGFVRSNNGKSLPVAPVVLIGLGMMFLLSNLGMLRIGQVLRFWPVFLIAIGLYMLYNRTRGEVNHE